VLQQKMSLVCFKEGSTDIIGMNLLLVRQANEKDLILEVRVTKTKSFKLRPNLF
jgi:hypothetical protein